ncbi:peptidase inhibitor family I36 protein [Allokutzneria sp. NRRL B-24872]|uniref:peptidase inhibitor family I36 protein n=1 Tax=Allokutzneria sp. NRRL B-24872 TaxID=1137961 RepID=UPI00143CF351|nr:peptidase inhibitor family I36 protein [Allokutzneria sp. NRRL B-24872]
MRKLRSVVAVLAVGGAMLAGVAPASANADDCSYKLCMWEDDWYADTLYAKSAAVSGCLEIAGWNGDNEISSLINNTGHTVRLYADDGCQGRSLPLGPGYYPELSRLGFNNEVESYSFDGT